MTLGNLVAYSQTSSVDLQRLRDAGVELDPGNSELRVSVWGHIPSLDDFVDETVRAIPDNKRTASVERQITMHD